MAMLGLESSGVSRSIAAIGFVVLICGCPRGNAAPPPGYTLVWSDEFNQPVGSPPDPKHWNHETGDSGYGNQELEDYVDDIEHAQIVADPSATDGRALQIEATKDASGRYFSARLNSAGHETPMYGFVEARIRLPRGQGIWPAFWLLGNNISTVGWPACGEMDVMENIGMESWRGLNEGSLHLAGRSGPDSLHASYQLPNGERFSDAYHLFQMLWLPNAISYYVDGRLYETRTPADSSGKWPFNQPAFMIVNLAVGGNFPGNPDATTIFPSKMLIDYVRIYTGKLRRPSAPVDLAARPDADGGGIDLSWRGSPGAMSYTIYRRSEGRTSVAARAVFDSAYRDRVSTPNVPCVYRVAADNAAGESARSEPALAFALPAMDRPYRGTPWAVPGAIDLADYDYGGEGVAFHNPDSVNHVGQYRANESISVEACSDNMARYDLGWTSPGEWLNYTVDVRAAGHYRLDVRAANGSGRAARVHAVDMNTDSTSGSIEIGPTSGWQSWRQFTSSIDLPKGKSVLRLWIDKAPCNFSALVITPSGNSNS
jgi:beta-glucanase (GH16 family)